MRDDITPAESIARQQIIAEAKRNIPVETMQDVDEIGPTISSREIKPY